MENVTCDFGLCQTLKAFDWGLKSEKLDQAVVNRTVELF